jgi:hypothetical protein
VVSRKFPYPPLPPTCLDCLALKTIGCYDLNQYLMKNLITSSIDMITSTLTLSFDLQATHFVEQFNSIHVFIYGNAVLYNENHQMSLQALDVLASSAILDEVTIISYPYHISLNSLLAYLGYFNSYIYHVLME